MNKDTGDDWAEREATPFDTGYRIGWELRQDATVPYSKNLNPYVYDSDIYNGFWAGWKAASVTLSDHEASSEEIQPYQEYKNPNTDILGKSLHIDDIVIFSGIGHMHTLSLGKVVDFNEENNKVVVEYTEYYPVEAKTTAEYFSKQLVIKQ